MVRVRHDCSMATASVVVGMIDLPADEAREFHRRVYLAVKACLAKYDELIARQDERLGTPSEN